MPLIIIFQSLSDDNKNTARKYFHHMHKKPPPKKSITWWGQPSETLIFIRVLLGVKLITNYNDDCYKNKK